MSEPRSLRIGRWVFAVVVFAALAALFFVGDDSDGRNELLGVAGIFAAFIGVSEFLRRR